MQAIMDLARLDLNDTAKIRYPDVDLLKDANDGVAKAYAYRPDLKYGSYGTSGTSTYTELTTASTFPLDYEYQAAVVSYIVARNQVGDDQTAIDQRAETEFKEYLRGLGVI